MPEVYHGAGIARAETRGQGVVLHNAQTQKIPVVSPAGLRIVNAGAAAGTAGVDVIPPTGVS